MNFHIFLGKSILEYFKYLKYIFDWMDLFIIYVWWKCIFYVELMHMLVWVCVYVCVFLRIVRMGENVWEWYGSCVIYVYKLTFVCNDIPCSISYLIKFFSVLFLIVLLCLFWLKNDQIYLKKNLLINNWLLTFLKKVSIKKRLGGDTKKRVNLVTRNNIFLALWETV